MTSGPVGAVVDDLRQLQRRYKAEGKFVEAKAVLCAIQLARRHLADPQNGHRRHERDPTDYHPTRPPDSAP